MAIARPSGDCSRRRLDVNATDADGGTALHWASYRDDLATVDLLLRAGARVNAANDLGATALWAASQNGSRDVVGRLLQAGADPNLALQSGETPLMVASRVGSAPVVSTAPRRGAKVTPPRPRRQTALMWAVAQQHPDVVQLLIAAGADIHARSAAWNLTMAVSPHGMLQYNKRGSARRRHRAVVRGAGRRSRVSEAAGGRRRECQRPRRLGSERNGNGCARRVH